MAQSHHFHVGERVRMIRTHRELPKGANGTIIRVFEAADCSDVQFDDYPGHWLVAHSDLELFEREAEAGQA